jgi:hypothetical protein
MSADYDWAALRQRARSMKISPILLMDRADELERKIQAVEASMGERATKEQARTAVQLWHEQRKLIIKIGRIVGAQQ